MDIHAKWHKKIRLTNVFMYFTVCLILLWRIVLYLYHFDRVTDPELLTIISGMNNTTCSSDPFPTRLLMSHLYAIVPILQHIVNLCLTTGYFPISCKSSIVIPLIKKPGLDREMLKNYRPVSNLSFFIQSY